MLVLAWLQEKHTCWMTSLVGSCVKLLLRFLGCIDKLLQHLCVTYNESMLLGSSQIHVQVCIELALDLLKDFSEKRDFTMFYKSIYSPLIYAC